MTTTEIGQELGGSVTGQTDATCVKSMISKLLTSLRRLEGSVLTDSTAGQVRGCASERFGFLR